MQLSLQRFISAIFFLHAMRGFYFVLVICSGTSENVKAGEARGGLSGGPLLA